MRTTTPYSFVVIYLCMALPVFFVMQYYVDSSDMIAYVILSENYLKYGLLTEANSHWSPLISLLLIPVNFFFDNHFTAFHFLQVIIGLTCIVQCSNWLKRCNLNPSLFLIAQVIFSVMIVYYGQLWGTPDLLFLTILLYGLYLFSFKKYDTPLLTGFVFGFLFLAKSFGLILFACIILCEILIYILYKNKNAKSEFFYLAKLFAGFFMIASLWVGVLSFKNDSFTYSTATDYNFNIMNSEINPDAWSGLKHPALLGKLIPPATEHAHFYWTTPYSYKLNEWRPWQSSSNMNHYFEIVKRNVASLASFYLGKDAGTVFFISLILMSVFLRKKMAAVFNRIGLLLVVALLCGLIYALILVNHRYVWIIDTAIIISFFLLMNEAFRIKKFYLVSITTGLFAAIAISEPCIEIYKHAFEGRNETLIAAECARMKLTAKNFASVETGEAIDNYTRSALISYYLHADYYGMLGYNNFKKEGKAELKKYAVDYLIVYNEKLIPAMHADFEKKLSLNGCYIYEVK